MVRREETARGPRIVVPLGGADHVLSIERATELRDGLTAALAPEATSRMSDARLAEIEHLLRLGPRSSRNEVASELLAQVKMMRETGK